MKKRALIKINPGALIHKDNWDKAMGLLKGYFDSHPNISLGDYRDLLGTSRKYAVLFLEYCDQQKITKKQDDVRILVQKSKEGGHGFRYQKHGKCGKVQKFFKGSRCHLSDPAHNQCPHQ